MKIHQTAIIEEGASIGEGTEIGPYCFIKKDVVIGKNNKLTSHIVIEGNTTIGDNNKIYQFASIGSDPQDLKFRGEPSKLEIGNGNIIREYVTIQPGTEGGGMLTKIGNNNAFMVHTHIAHDVIMGDRNIMVNGASLAGHITVGNNVIMGAHTGYHQFIRLGDNTIISGGSMVVKDIPPYCNAQGDRAGLAGINKLGLERAGFTSDEIRNIRNVYKEVFLVPGILKEKLEKLEKDFAENEKVKRFITFLKESQRGVTFPRKSDSQSEED